jgi:hypothetical protein
MESTTMTAECLCCGKARTLRDGLCHECEQEMIDATYCVQCNKAQDDCECVDGPWLPGGYSL